MCTFANATLVHFVGIVNRRISLDISLIKSVPAFPRGTMKRFLRHFMISSYIDVIALRIIVSPSIVPHFILFDLIARQVAQYHGSGDETNV